MDELTQIRLTVALLATGAVLAWFLARASRRRRDARFAALARSLGGEATREHEFLSRFSVDVDGRHVEVRMQHIGGAGGNPGPVGWRLVSEVQLEGITDLHSADIRLRSWRRKVVETDAAEFETYFEIRDAGLPLRQGWLNARMREAIVRFFALGLSYDPLSIENARLIHRSSVELRKFDGAVLRELLARQVAVAAALERTL